MARFSQPQLCFCDFFVLLCCWPLPSHVLVILFSMLSSFLPLPFVLLCVPFLFLPLSTFLYASSLSFSALAGYLSRPVSAILCPSTFSTLLFPLSAVPYPSLPLGAFNTHLQAHSDTNTQEHVQVQMRRQTHIQTGMHTCSPWSILSCQVVL